MPQRHFYIKGLGQFLYKKKARSSIGHRLKPRPPKLMQFSPLETLFFWLNHGTITNTHNICGGMLIKH